MALPIKYVKYCENVVKVYEVDKKHYMTGEDLGKCLGYADPLGQINRIYGRHKDELEQHTGVVKLTTPGGKQDVRVYSQKGCYLVAMFAKTKKAKEVRSWLADLPEKLQTIRRRYKHLREEGDLVALAKAEGLADYPGIGKDRGALEALIESKVDGKGDQKRQVAYYYRKQFDKNGKIPFGVCFKEGRKASGRRPKYDD